MSGNVTFNEEKIFNRIPLSAGQTQLEQEEDLSPVAFICELLNDNVVPKSTEETKEHKKWYEAMQSEYNSLIENDVWKLVDN